MGKNKIIITVFSIIIAVLISIIIIEKHYINIDKRTVVIRDTVYNHKIIDSLAYNIIYRDSIIYKLKVKEYEEIIESRNLSDSASVELLYELLSE